MGAVEGQQVPEGAEEELGSHGCIPAPGASSSSVRGSGCFVPPRRSREHPQPLQRPQGPAGQLSAPAGLGRAGRSPRRSPGSAPGSAAPELDPSAPSPNTAWRSPFHPYTPGARTRRKHRHLRRKPRSDSKSCSFFYLLVGFWGCFFANSLPPRAAAWQHTKADLAKWKISTHASCILLPEWNVGNALMHLGNRDMTEKTKT